MPALIEQSIYHDGKEHVQDRKLIVPGKFMPMEFYTPDHQLLAAYVIAVTDEDFGSKVIQWTTRTSRAAYPEMNESMEVSELAATSNEEVAELTYGGTPKTIVVPRLVRAEPVSMFTVSHKPIERAGEILL